MTVVIDPDFSVYKLVNRIRNTSTILTHRRTMSVMSYEIENATLVDQAETRIFAGFQRFSKFIPQIERYTKLAQNAEKVYVFGIPDTILPAIANIEYIKLEETDQLAKEWFLISHGKEYHSILATEEISEINDPDESRVFHGIWTFDPEMVKIVEEWVSSAVDAPPLILDKGYNDKRQTQIMGSTIQRLLKRTEDKAIASSPQKNIVAGQVKSIVKERLQPELNALTGHRMEDNLTEREAVILFSDIRNFTALAEQYQPRELVERILNPYINILSYSIAKHGGVIDKFLGDGILATFGLDGELDEPATCALNAAIDAMAELRLLQSPDFPIGIGLSHGNVLMGSIGNELVNEKTVIGDVVNIAQRLSTLGYNGIWLCEEVYAKLPDTAELTSIGEFMLKGKSSPNQVYRYNQDVAYQQAN